MFGNFHSTFCGLTMDLVKAVLGLAILDIIGRIFFLIQDFQRDFRYEIVYFHVETVVQFLNVLTSMIIPIQLIYGALKVWLVIFFQLILSNGIFITVAEVNAGFMDVNECFWNNFSDTSLFRLHEWNLEFSWWCVGNYWSYHHHSFCITDR